MLPPKYQQEIIDRADLHLQVQLEFVEPNAKTPGYVTVKAKVVRIFRGPRGLHPGDRITFQMAVITDENIERGEVPIGSTSWTNYSALLNARYMEVLLIGPPPNCVPVESEFLPEPTEDPVIPHRSKRKWYRFWK